MEYRAPTSHPVILTLRSPGEYGGRFAVVQLPVAGNRVLELGGGVPVSVQTIPGLEIHHGRFFSDHCDIIMF